MKNKAFLMLSCLVLLLAVFPKTAFADVGPKPSVIIDFAGMPDEDYYVTLLSDAWTTGPHTALESTNSTYSRYKEGDKDYDIFVKFAGYEDADGYYFLQFFQNCTETNQFSWTYYPPEFFKILVYFPQSDRFAVSGEVYERYAFHSYYTVNFAGQAADITAERGLSAVRSYDYSGEIVSLVVRIILTIAIEALIGLLCGFRAKKQLWLIVRVNLITQILLNVAANTALYLSGAFGFVGLYFLLELPVLIIEATIYAKRLGKYGEKPTPTWMTGLYAFIANAVSFFAGLGIALLVPGLF